MKLDCRQIQKMAGAFADGSLNDRDLARVLDHIRTCGACYEEFKTTYLINYALSYMDRNRQGALDIDRLMDDKVKSSEAKLARHRIYTILLLAGIIVVGALTAAVVLSLVFPGLAPTVTETVNGLIERLI